MNIPKLLKAYEDILRYNEGEDPIKMVMAMYEFNSYIMHVENLEHEGEHNFVPFSDVRGSFCDKCGAILPF